MWLHSGKHPLKHVFKKQQVAQPVTGGSNIKPENPSLKKEEIPTDSKYQYFYYFR